MEDGRINTATGQLMLGAFDTSGTPFGGIESGTPYWSNSYAKLPTNNALLDSLPTKEVSWKVMGIALTFILMIVVSIIGSVIWNVVVG